MASDVQPGAAAVPASASAQTASTAPPSTWLRALEQHVESLDKPTRRRFVSPASPEDCLAAIQSTKHKKRKTERLLSFLRPAIEPLKRFEGAIDVITQTNAGIAAPIWGPLRLGITVSLFFFPAKLVIFSSQRPYHPTGVAVWCTSR